MSKRWVSGEDYKMVNEELEKQEEEEEETKTMIDIWKR